MTFGYKCWGIWMACLFTSVSLCLYREERISSLTGIIRIYSTNTLLSSWASMMPVRNMNRLHSGRGINYSSNLILIMVKLCNRHNAYFPTFENTAALHSQHPAAYRIKTGSCSSWCTQKRLLFNRTWTPTMNKVLATSAYLYLYFNANIYTRPNGPFWFFFFHSA